MGNESRMTGKDANLNSYFIIHTSLAEVCNG